MTNISIKQTIAYIKQEIELLYPAQEVDAMISIILQHTLKLSRAEIYLNMATNVSKTALEEIKKITLELKKYKPLQYILGETCFYGLRIIVNQNVLIPRPETEELVDWILKENNLPNLRIVDLGTGSGCIAVSLAKERPNWKVMAVDVSQGALLVANKNASINNVNIDFYEDDILEPTENLKKIKFNIIVSNPPYVTHDQKTKMHANVIDYEPHLALFSHINDPLIFYKKIAMLAASNLELGGAVYAEINENLPNETASIFKELDFRVEIKKDINNKYRMLKAYKK